MPKILVVVTFQFEGFHCWPMAPHPHTFLRSRHRHMFHVKAGKRVSHDDREIEIIELKRLMLESALKRGAELGSDSCETLALQFLSAFDLAFCEVLEDGENGALVSQ